MKKKFKTLNKRTVALAFVGSYMQVPGTCPDQYLKGRRVTSMASHSDQGSVKSWDFTGVFDEKQAIPLCVLFFISKAIQYRPSLQSSIFDYWRLDLPLDHLQCRIQCRLPDRFAVPGNTGSGLQCTRCGQAIVIYDQLKLLVWHRIRSISHKQVRELVVGPSVLNLMYHRLSDPNKNTDVNNCVLNSLGCLLFCVDVLVDMPQWGECAVSWFCGTWRRAKLCVYGWWQCSPLGNGLGTTLSSLFSKTHADRSNYFGLSGVCALFASWSSLEFCSVCTVHAVSVAGVVCWNSRIFVFACKISLFLTTITWSHFGFMLHRLCTKWYWLKLTRRPCYAQ